MLEILLKFFGPFRAGLISSSWFVLLEFLRRLVAFHNKRLQRHRHILAPISGNAQASRFYVSDLRESLYWSSMRPSFYLSSLRLPSAPQIRKILP